VQAHDTSISWKKNEKKIRTYGEARVGANTNWRDFRLDYSISLHSSSIKWTKISERHDDTVIASLQWMSLVHTCGNPVTRMSDTPALR